MGTDRYRMHQSAEVVSILDGDDGAVVQVSRALGNPRARLLALELCERLNHEDDAEADR